MLAHPLADRVRPCGGIYRPVRCSGWGTWDVVVGMGEGMGTGGWRWCPAFFAVALVCFFLPFVTVSCTTPEADIATLSGVQLAVGYTIDDADLTTSVSTDETSGRELLALVALVAVVVGLGVSFLRSRAGAIMATIAGVVILLSLIALMIKLNRDVASNGEGVLRIKYSIFYYLTLLLGLGATIVNVMLLRTDEPPVPSSGADLGTPPDPAPPPY
jgi:hypothetical protein